MKQNTLRFLKDSFQSFRFQLISKSLQNEIIQDTNRPLIYLMDIHICTKLLGLVTEILKAGKQFLYYYENYSKYKVEVSVSLQK